MFSDSRAGCGDLGTPYLSLACQMTEILFKSAKFSLSNLKLEVCMIIYEQSLDPILQWSKLSV